MLNDILALIEQQRQTVIDLQRLLVSTPAIGPEYGGSGERDKADKLKAFMAALGLPPVQEFNAPDERVPCGHRPNLVCLFPGKDTSRTFWIMSHMDVVPAGDASLWKSDPFELVVEGDELRGRGVEDNHQGLVTSLLLAKALTETASLPPVNLGLLLVADEETGNKLGIGYLLENHRDLFKPDDLFLVPDSGSPDSLKVEIAEAGILWIKVTVLGKQCHASLPHHGVNSLRAASDFIVRLREVEATFTKPNPLFNPPTTTIEPTRKEENVQNINTIPGRDVFYIDCRVLPHYTLDEVYDAIKTLGSEIETKHKVIIEYDTPQFNRAAPVTPENSAIVKKLMAAIRAECGKEPIVEGVGGGTVAAFLRRAGYPAVVWSTIYENPHVPNERANISFVLRDARIMARTLFEA